MLLLHQLKVMSLDWSMKTEGSDSGFFNSSISKHGLLTLRPSAEQSEMGQP
jgi:hypothetical protein